MVPKPRTKAEYDAAFGQMDSLKAGVIELMTRLGDVADQLVIVGGYAPVLLFADAEVPPTGTMDVDFGLSVALLAEERYQALEDRLRASGFRPDVNDRGNETHQRWISDLSKGGVRIDLLMGPGDSGAQGGTVQHLTPSLAAYVIPGIELAHHDVERPRLSGQALNGGWAEREVAVCGPGAFVVLKALAFASRGEEKDAHDLVYALECAGVDEVAKRIAGFPESEPLNGALEALREDFLSAGGIGPVRVAQFRGTPDEAVQAEAAGRVRALLLKLGRV